jgi:hypothetical protein
MGAGLRVGEFDAGRRPEGDCGLCRPAANENGSQDQKGQTEREPHLFSYTPLTERLSLLEDLSDVETVDWASVRE